MDFLCDVLSEETGQLINCERIANTYRSVAKDAIDKAAVKKYINFFVDAFCLKASRFD